MLTNMKGHKFEVISVASIVINNIANLLKRYNSILIAVHSTLTL